MLGAWLFAPCDVGALCCYRARKKKRRGALVLRRFHVLLAGTFAFACIYVLNLDSSVPSRREATPSLPTAHLDDPEVTRSALRGSVARASAAAEELSASTAVPPAILPAPPAEPSWKRLPVDWHDTQLGPGFPNKIDSAWSDIGVMRTGHVLRIEADGYDSKESPIAVWGWYINIWSGDGRHWVTKKGASEPSRLVHFNPRPRGGGYIAMNHFLKGSGWGPEKNVPIPPEWQLENAAKPFEIELELGNDAWSFKLNGKLQPKMTYDRKGDFYGPLVLQLYGLLNPRVSLKKQRHVPPPAPPPAPPADLSWKQLPVDWHDTQLGPGFPNKIDSAWSDIGVMKSGNVLRIEAGGYDSTESPIAVWGWYINIWSGDGRHWVTKKGASEPSRLVHFNPRPRGGGYIAMNHFLKGSGWGPEKDVPIPPEWQLENAAKPFEIELELGNDAWSFKLNGKLQPKMSYDRKGDFSGPLVLQLYGLLNPRVSLSTRRH
eukprot:TRINITY_DN13699_c0_g1_i2.p1 TRINITY_DN13699_c0_g1~~TRINITY_DN13699_c0_g1_i2.p1  ORF type:complete len:488 (-),score=72.63 TRINITY_DN13699_c0_g1_i2:24-1487(-)